MSLHVVFALLIIEFTLLFGSGILVLLILRHEIVHVALSFRELHLVHPLAGVPMQERLAAEHRCEILGHTLEHLLDRSRVTSERDGHFQALRRDVAHARFDV